MKKILYSCIVISVVVLSSFRALPQKHHLLPGDSNQDSSVSEIITRLDQTSFRNARIVLKDSVDAFTYRSQLDDDRAQTTFVFTPGFRVTSIDRCNLMLRNDDAKRIIKSKVEDYSSRVVADVWVQLNRMSPNKGRANYRYTKDPEKMRLFGAWRTNFKYRGWSSRTIVGLTLSSAEWKVPQRWEGMNVAFIFDTKEMSEEFDAAFRHAIKLCNSK